MVPLFPASEKLLKVTKLISFEPLFWFDLECQPLGDVFTGGLDIFESIFGSIPSTFCKGII